MNMGREEQKNIYVFIEEDSTQSMEIGYELLGEARRLLCNEQKLVCAVVCMKETKEMLNAYFAYGADLVYAIPMSEPKAIYTEKPVLKRLQKLIELHQPEVFLFGATIQGREVAAYLASVFNTGLTADCTRLSMDWEQGLLYQTRPACEGDLFATIVCEKQRPQMATVRPGVMKKLIPDWNRKGEVIVLSEPEILQPRVQIIESLLELKSENQLAIARVVIGIGAGIANKENFEKIKELVQPYGISIGVTRPVVDCKIAPYDHQIGLTGVNLQADFYIACGISGAVQHTSGLQNVKHIVAINTDEQAPIFQIAQYGVIGDAMDVLPDILHAIYMK